jgi:hypothetical protein
MITWIIIPSWTFIIIIPNIYISSFRLVRVMPFDNLIIFDTDWFNDTIISGVKQWFISCKIPAHQVIELDWHQESVIRIPRSFSSYRDNGYPPTHGRPSTSTEQEPLTSNLNSHFDDREFGESNSSLTLKVICTPAQHRSGRGIFDHFKTLWGSWVVGVVNGNGDEDPFEGSVRNENGGKERFGPEDGFRMFFAGYVGWESWRL